MMSILANRQSVFLLLFVLTIASIESAKDQKFRTERKASRDKNRGKIGADENPSSNGSACQGCEGDGDIFQGQETELFENSFLNREERGSAKDNSMAEALEEEDENNWRGDLRRSTPFRKFFFDTSISNTISNSNLNSKTDPKRWPSRPHHTSNLQSSDEAFSNLDSKSNQDRSEYRNIWVKDRETENLDMEDSEEEVDLHRQSAKRSQETISHLSPATRRFLFSPTIQNTITNLNQNLNTQTMQGTGGSAGTREFKDEKGSEKQILGHLNNAGELEYDIRGKANKICFILG